MNEKYIEIAKREDGTILLDINKDAQKYPTRREVIDTFFDIAELSEFDKAVFLTVCTLRDEKENIGFPKVEPKTIKRPLPLEDKNNTIGGVLPCEISYLEIYRKVMDKPNATYISKDEINPIRKSIERLGKCDICMPYPLNQPVEILNTGHRYTKTEYFLYVDRWDIYIETMGEVGFIQIAREKPSLIRFLDAANKQYTASLDRK